MLYPVSVCKYTRKGKILLSVCDYKPLLPSRQPSIYESQGERYLRQEEVICVATSCLSVGSEKGGLP